MRLHIEMGFALVLMRRRQARCSIPVQSRVSLRTNERWTCSWRALCEGVSRGLIYRRWKGRQEPVKYELPCQSTTGAGRFDTHQSGHVRSGLPSWEPSEFHLRIVLGPGTGGQYLKTSSTHLALSPTDPTSARRPHFGWFRHAAPKSYALGEANRSSNIRSSSETLFEPVISGSITLLHG